MVKSKASTVVASLARVAGSGKNGQGDGATLAGGEKENLIPPMLLADLTTTATKSKKHARTLADTKLEMEVISQCGSGGLDDYKPSRTNMARMKLEGQLDVVEYSRITVPDSVHVRYPAGARTDLQVRLAWCLMGIKNAEYEANNDSISKEQELELMEARRMLISRDDSAIAWAKRKDALCFVRFVVDRIPTPVLVECIKTIRQGGVDGERNLLRTLLEQYQDMPLGIPNKESNDMESYRRLEEVRRYSNKELKLSREFIERVRGQKDCATQGKLTSFQYVSGIPGMAYNPFVNEEAREAYFDYEQVVVLDFWVERVKEISIMMMELPKLGTALEERVVEPSVPERKGQVSFDCGFWDGPLKTSLVTMWELMKPSSCPHLNAG